MGFMSNDTPAGFGVLHSNFYNLVIPLGLKGVSCLIISEQKAYSAC